MARTRIKICGIRDMASALIAAEAGADAIGLVFVEKSPRFVTVAAARAIVSNLPALVEPVALFADASVDHVRETARAVGVRTLQLHGSETHEMVASLAEFRVIKAVNFAGIGSGQGDASQFDQWMRRPWPVNVCALLVDAPQEKGAGHDRLTGGGGKAFDWTRLAAVVGGAHPTQGSTAAMGAARPQLILAGGLTPENVAEAIRVVKPWAVDVSSGVESSRGVKDAGKIRAFCQAVNAAAP